jgi:sugar lactone lactonase YvrE
MPLGLSRGAISYMSGGGAGGSAPASGWNISSTSYDSVSFLISGQETSPSGMFFKPDGTGFYIVGAVNDTVYQYTLSTAWNLSTASYASKSFSVSSQAGGPSGVFFKSDGTKMYVVNDGSGATNAVYQYSLSTAWDVSTASYDSVTYSVTTQADAPRDVFFSSDGTKMYIADANNIRVYQYSLSTAWDLSTTSYASKSLLVSSEDANPQGLSFKDDGTIMYLLGTGNDSVYQYTLSTAWDLATATYASKSFSVSGQDGTASQICFKDDGTKMYYLGGVNDRVFQYTVGS